MAPALIMNISSENNDKYTHKKFQGKRNYSHKKFGSRIFSSPPKLESVIQKTSEEIIPRNNKTSAATTKQRTADDLFRPYDLPDKTTRKRKHQKLQTEPTSEEYEMKFKKIALSAPPTPSPSPPTPSPSPPAFFIHNTNFVNPSPIITNPCYRLQHYQFNPQIFALILQKQRAALYMGEILKRQANLNFNNLQGQ